MTPPRRSGVVWPPLVVLAVALGIIEAVVRVGWVPAFLIPPPTDAMAALVRSRGEIAVALGETALAAVVGFLLSVVVGIAIGVALSAGGWVRRAFYPYAILFQTVPIVAVAPLFVIWFGYDPKTRIASAFVASVFPVIANTLAGLLSTDPPLVDLFRLYRAGPLTTLLKLRLPFALPHIFTGLRVAAGLAVIGAIVGEFIANGGLGSLIVVSRQQQRTDKVFAALFVASLLGVAMFAIINTLARVCLRHWHASERSGER